MEQDERQQALLFANIAAQLRGALSNLRLAASQLVPPAQREQDSELDARAALLDQSYYQLLRLVNDLSAASQYLGGGQPLPLQDRDIVDTVRELCVQAEGPAALLGLELRFVCAADQHVCAFHLPGLELLVHQLLSNALKFTPAGGTVTVELKFHAKRVLLSVEDTGRGIAPEHLEALFDRYLHGEPLAPAPQGLGLGLPLCRRIAEGHGGTIMAESSVGKGSRFTLSIPDRQTGTPGLSDVALDYSGGFNRTLLALADALPAKAFLLRNQG